MWGARMLGRFRCLPHVSSTEYCQHEQEAVSTCRFQYDPNPKVREAMGAIWRALVPEPRAAVDAHWDAIAGELLSEMGGRLWRNREAAALGLADLLQVRFQEILLDTVLWRRLHGSAHKATVNACRQTHFCQGMLTSS